jgi:hypothetical protein
MRRLLRDLCITAGYEFLDAIRSRRAIVLLLLYFAGALLACNGYVKFIQSIEQQVLESLAVSPGEGVGGVTETLWETSLFRRTVTRLVGDEVLAEHLVNTPPIALFYGWLSFTFAPMLMMLIACTRVAEDVGSGAARFVLFRTSLLSWCLGKYAGQALVLVPALLLSAVGAWVVGYARLATFAGGPAAVGLLVYSGKVFIYTLCYLGLALGVSQLTRSSTLATVFGFLGLVGLSVLAAVAGHCAGEGWGQLWYVVRWLTPQGHRLDLWWPDAAHAVPAAVLLLALGMMYLLPGYVVMKRRDH